ncbi:hypothetical protein GCM10017706_16570 [Lactococcus lactis subsp. hordniae]
MKILNVGKVEDMTLKKKKGNTNNNQVGACPLGVTDDARSCVPKAEAWNVGFVRSTKWVVGR